MPKINSKTKNQTLAKIVSINSVFSKEKKLALFLEARLRKYGFKTTRQRVGNGRFNLFAQLGDSKKAVLFYGHLDTVPPYGKWASDPFTAKISGDKLYGLGACDMKGGIAAILEAAKYARGHNVKILFCVDEENISAGAWAAVKKKRRWFDGVSLIISGEPGASNKDVGGTSRMTVGRRGRLVFNLDIIGMSYHGAIPKKGISAIDEASKIVVSLPKFNLIDHQIGKETLFVRVFESRSTSVSLPDRVHLEIDMHIVPPTDAQSAKRRLNSFITSLKEQGVLNKSTKTLLVLRPRETPYIPPYLTDLNSKRVQHAKSIMKKVTGRFNFNFASSVADDNIFAANLGVPLIAIGPKGGNLHSKNEWVSLKSYRELILLYQKIIEELA